MIKIKLKKFSLLLTINEGNFTSKNDLKTLKIMINQFLCLG